MQTQQGSIVGVTEGDTGSVDYGSNGTLGAWCLHSHARFGETEL